MRPDREHPLYHLDAETLLVATYIWVDDALKALQAQGIRLPKPQRHQKATLPELLTIALFLTLIGLDLSKGYPPLPIPPPPLLPLPTPPLPLPPRLAKRPVPPGPPGPPPGPGA
ncbi:MAG: hypothetical protein QXT77_03900, partial [Candidatus Methanomethylicaceae archaeon]